MTHFEALSLVIEAARLHHATMASKDAQLLEEAILIVAVREFAKSDRGPIPVK